MDTTHLYMPFLPRVRESVTQIRPHRYYGETPEERVLDLSRFEIPDVIVCGSADFLRNPPLNPPHMHDNLEICYLAEGVRTNASAGDTWHLKAGDLWINKPGVVHGSTVCPNGPSKFYYLEIANPDCVASIAGLSPEESRAFWEAWLALPASVVRAGLDYAAYFENIFGVIDSPDTRWRATRLRTAVNALLFSAFSLFQASPARAPSTEINRALAWIAANPPDTELTIEMLASHIGLSLSAFKARFRQEVGIPPAQFLLRRRVAAAAQMLIDSDLPVVDIASRFRFASSQHFSVVFKDYTGETPITYRKTRRQKPPAV